MFDGTAGKVLSAIDSMGLSNWYNFGGNKWRGSSPIRPGSDGDNFTLVIYDAEHGAYTDWKAAESGSLYELANQLGIEPPKSENGSGAPARSFLGLEDYARAHGLTADDLRAAKWEEVEHQGRPALQYPIKNADGTIERRWRFIDGKKPKYISAPGHRGAWYNLRGAAELAKQLGKPLVICNGEISTLAARAHGIPACATTQGEKANGLSPHLLTELNTVWQGDVLIAVENDEAGAAYSKAVAKQLEGRARVIDLGGTNDLADWCVLHGAESRDDLYAGQDLFKPSEIQDIAPLADGIIEFKSLVDASLEGASTVKLHGLASGFPKLDDVTAGFCAGEVTVILGDTGMGKSTLAASLVSNLMLLAPGYVETTELTREQYIMKLACAMTGIPASLVRHKHLTAAQVKLLKDAADVIGMYVVVTPHKRSTPEEMQERLKRSIDKYGVQWAMIDSINKLRFDFTNSGYTAMTEASQIIEESSKEFNIPFIVTSQIGRKINDNPRPPQLHDAKNSGAIEEDASFVFGLYNHHYYVKRGFASPDEKHPENIAWLHVLKTRWDDIVEPIPVEFVGGASIQASNGVVIKRNIEDVL